LARKIAKKKRGGRPSWPERPFSNSSGGPGPVITKAKDNGFKIIFCDHNISVEEAANFANDSRAYSTQDLGLIPK
jgi:hypothetical protein